MLRTCKLGMIILCIGFLATGCVSLVEQGALYLYNRSDVAITHYDLKIDVNEIKASDPNKRAINVDLVATMSVKSLKANVGSMYFFLDEGFTLLGVTIDGKPAKFSKWKIPSGLLSVWWVDFPQKLKKEEVKKVTISYSQEKESYFSLPQIHYDTAVAWYPGMLKENLYTLNLTATVPNQLTPIVPGELVSTHSSQGRTTYQFASTVPSPLVNFLALSVEKTTFNYPDGRPVHVYYTPRQSSAVSALADIVYQARRFYEQQSGPFLAESTSVVIFDSAMEMAYSTPYGIVLSSGIVARAIHTNDFTILSHTLAHELAHYYWGYTTVPLLTEGWILAEGLAEYSAKLFLDSNQASDGVRLMQGNYTEYAYILREIKKEGSAEMPLAKITFVYQDQFDLLIHKGVYVHQMLADIVGEGIYRTVLADLYSNCKGDTVSLPQWQKAVEKASRQNLDWFFKDWVYGTAHVDFAVTEVTSNTKGKAVITIANLGSAMYKGPVEIRIDTAEHSRTFNVVLDKAKNTITCDIEGQLQGVVVDPNWRLLDIKRDNNYVNF
ncbi:MAG: hypothetical protein PHV61_05225 [Limnochordia bacterium]|nr:hypothetical protein [Limnochordia bacterium]